MAVGSECMRAHARACMLLLLHRVQELLHAPACYYCFDAHASYVQLVQLLVLQVASTGLHWFAPPAVHVHCCCLHAPAKGRHVQIIDKCT